VAGAVAVGAVLLGSAACGSSGSSGSSGPSGGDEQVAGGGTTVAVGPADAEFCEMVTSIGEVPESYVGSSAHLADVEALVAVAPPAIVGDLETFRLHIASGGITDDPDSKDIANYPPDVRRAVEQLEAYVTSTC